MKNDLSLKKTSPKKSEYTMSNDAIFIEINERIERENELIHHRMTWLGTFQGLLFGAVAIFWGSKNAAPLILLSCVVGSLVSISIGIAVRRANLSIKQSSQVWDNIRPTDWCRLDSEGFRSDSGASWIMPGSFIPWLFLATWGAILLLLVSIVVFGFQYTSLY